MSTNQGEWIAALDYKIRVIDHKSSPYGLEQYTLAEFFMQSKSWATK